MRNLYLFAFFLCQQGLTQELKILTVDEPPVSYINQDNQADGYIIAIVNALQKSLDTEVEMVFVPEARALNIMANQANVMLLGISRTPAREQHFIWVAPLMFKKWQVYTLAQSAIEIKNIDDLRALSSIGVVRGDVREEWLVNKNFKNLNSVTLHKQNMQMLGLGRVNAIVYDKQGLIYQASDLGLELSDFKAVFTLNMAPVYIVMSIGSSTSLVEQWQAAFATLVANGELRAISEVWQARLMHKYQIQSEIQDNILVF